MTGRSSETDSSRGALQRRHYWLLGALAAVLIAYVATWPLRSRLVRQTTLINQQVAAQQAQIRAANLSSASLSRAEQDALAHPRSYQARLNLAQAELRAGNLAGAVRDGHGAEQLNPRVAAPDILLGQAYDALNMPDLSVVGYRLALQKDPNSQDALLGLAYKYITFGWNSAATALLRSHLNDPGSVDRIHAAMALAAFQTGDMADAEKELVAAHLENPSDPRLTLPLIEVYRRSGRYRQALQVVSKMPPATGSYLLPLLAKSEIELQMNRPEAALSAANEALQLNAHSVQALYDRALAERDLGRPSDEERDLEAVKQVSPGTDRTRLLLGQLKVREGHAAEGEALLKAYSKTEAENEEGNRLQMAVAYNSDSAQAHLKQAQFLASVGNFPQAIVEFKRTLELAPAEPRARSGLIAALRAVGREDEARAVATGSEPRLPVHLAG